MASYFGADFSQVRVHVASAGAAGGRDASAFTSGEDVWFANGRFAPHTQEGASLLAHELTHVLQQRRGGGAPGAGHEIEAQTAARAVSRGTRPIVRLGSTLGAIQRAAPPGRDPLGALIDDPSLPVEGFSADPREARAIGSAGERHQFAEAKAALEREGFTEIQFRHNFKGWVKRAFPSKTWSPEVVAVDPVGRRVLVEDFTAGPWSATEMKPGDPRRLPQEHPEDIGVKPPEQKIAHLEKTVDNARQLARNLPLELKDCEVVARDRYWKQGGVSREISIKPAGPPATPPPPPVGTSPTGPLRTTPQRISETPVAAKEAPPLTTRPTEIEPLRTTAPKPAGVERLPPATAESSAVEGAAAAAAKPRVVEAPPAAAARTAPVPATAAAPEAAALVRLASEEAAIAPLGRRGIRFSLTKLEGTILTIGIQLLIDALLGAYYAKKEKEKIEALFRAEVSPKVAVRLKDLEAQAQQLTADNPYATIYANVTVRLDYSGFKGKYDEKLGDSVDAVSFRDTHISATPEHSFTQGDEVTTGRLIFSAETAYQGWWTITYPVEVHFDETSEARERRQMVFTAAKLAEAHISARGFGEAGTFWSEYQTEQFVRAYAEVTTAKSGMESLHDDAVRYLEELRARPRGWREARRLRTMLTPFQAGPTISR